MFLHGCLGENLGAFVS